MSGSKIPEDVRLLLQNEIRSVAHLEILLQLHARPGEWWSAERMAGELRMSSAAVGERMEELSVGGLLEARTGEGRSFRYAPVRPETDRAVAALARLYPDWRVSIIELIFARRTDPVREFSEAFRIHKEEPDDRG
jgi:hypothetical protein